jgi:hypothetical protein
VVVVVISVQMEAMVLIQVAMAEVAMVIKMEQ